MSEIADRDVPTGAAARADLDHRLRQSERELQLAREAAQEQREIIVAQAEEIAALRASDLRPEVERLADELAAQHIMLTQTYEAMRKQEQDVSAWRASGAVRLAYFIQRGTTLLAPPGTARQRGLRRTVLAGMRLARGGRTALHKVLPERGVGRFLEAGKNGQAQYDRWREIHEPTAAELERMRRDNGMWELRPLISIIMPTYNPEPDWIRRAIDSVTGQVYENWELCIADDASTESHVHTLLARHAAADPRIKLVLREQNGGIADASASALQIATGEFVAFLDHDDVLRPHALQRVVEYVRSSPHTDIVYSDEDLLLSGGRRGSPHFKPDFSPDLLLSVNYMCHLLVARRALVEQVGGFRQGFDGAQDHDLILRLTEAAHQVGHVPDVLYSWTQVEGSVAAAPTAKMYAYEAGRRAVRDALDRRGVKATVSFGDQLGTYSVRRAVLGEPEVAIIIPTRDRVDLLRECLTSVETLSTYKNWTITIVDNGSVEAETLDFLEGTGHAVVRRAGPFNYSELMNFGRSQVDAQYLLMINNDIVTTTPDWIEALLEHAQRPEVGAVGARLVYPDGTTQHEGIGLGNICMASTAVNLDAGWMGRVVRDVSAVTGACQMVRSSVFDEVGGYDEAMPLAYNDVDFCLRVRATGRLVVYTPHAQLSHREGASRGRTHQLADEELFWRRWGREGGIADPYISPHLRSLNPLQLRLGGQPTDR
jgi:O-antigen biosynthesis protein